MSKYIDADLLRKEINKWTDAMSDNIEDDYSDGVRFALNHFVFILESLQQEQPVLPGIEDPGIPGKDFIPVEWVDACEMYGKWKIVKQEQPEVDLEKEIEEHVYSMPHCEFSHYTEDLEDEDWARAEFRYFYELGLNARKEE